MNRTSTLAAMAVLILLVLGLQTFSPNFTERVPGSDFMQFYFGAMMYRLAPLEQLYDLDLQEILQHDPSVMPIVPDADYFIPYIYPPFFLWVCLPFSYLPFPMAAKTWMWMMAGIFVAAGWLLVKQEQLDDYFGRWLFIGTLFAPTMMALYTCQNSTLTLLLFVCTYVLLRRGHPMWAGLVFSLLTYKPQMIIVFSLWMFLMGQWTFVAGALLGGVGLIAAAVAIHPTSIPQYLELAPVLSNWIDYPGMAQHMPRMASWQGFWRLLLPDVPVTWIRRLHALSAVVSLAVLARLFRRPFDVTGPEFPRQFSALVVATVITSPHMVYYDLCLLLIPMTLMWNKDAEGEVRWLRRNEALLAVVLLSPFVAEVTRFNLVVPAMLLYLGALTIERDEDLASSPPVSTFE